MSQCLTRRVPATPRYSEISSAVCHSSNRLRTFYTEVSNHFITSTAVPMANGYDNSFGVGTSPPRETRIGRRSQKDGLGNVQRATALPVFALRTYINSTYHVSNPALVDIARNELLERAGIDYPGAVTLKAPGPGTLGTRSYPRLDTALPDASELVLGDIG